MRFRVVITSPTNVQLDATVRLDAGAAGTISAVPESDLGILTHSDMALNLDNSDGAIDAFFLGAVPSDIYEIVLERERPAPGGWDRLFGGVLDVKSLSYNDKAKTAHIVAYSYSKQLERTPADTIKRTLASKTVSITSGTSQLVFLTGEASDLEVGDVIHVDDGSGNTEEFTVDLILDTSNVKTTAAASRTYTSSYATVTTPFYHDKSPDELFTLIAAESGVEYNNLNQGNPIADVPIATPLTRAGLNLNGVPVSLVPDVATISSVVTPVISATFPSSYWASGKRKVTPGPKTPWIDGATSNQPQLDWTPYLNSKPTTIIVDTVNAADINEVSPDHTGGHRYHSGSAAGTALFLDGSTNLGVWDGSSPQSTDEVLSTEFDPTSGRVFLCHYDTGNPSVQKFRYYDGTFHDIATVGVGGWLRCVKYFNTTMLLRVDVYTNDLYFYDPVTLDSTTVNTTAFYRKITWGYPNDIIFHRTVRVWGVGPTVGGLPGWLWMSFLFERGGETFVAIFDARYTIADWKLLATYRVASDRPLAGAASTTGLRHKYAYQTVLTLSSGEQLAVGYAAGEWFVLATYFAGVIRYADFSDSSCAKAAKDVATVLGGLVNFDAFRVMTIVNRKTLVAGDVVADLPAPLEQERSPISETYRASVQVNGQDINGGAISEVQGDAGDSSSRLIVDSDMISTPGMALACGLASLQFVSQIRQQRNITIIDDGTPLTVFDRVSFDGKEWVIYKIETDLEQQTHDLVLLELLP